MGYASDNSRNADHRNDQDQDDYDLEKDDGDQDQDKNEHFEKSYKGVDRSHQDTYREYKI